MALWTVLAASAVLLVAAFAWGRIRAAAQARSSARLDYFAVCAPLFSAVRIRATDHGFARLNGHRSGHLVDLQAVPDTLTFRKLPSLWLMVTLPTPQPVAASADFMARPTGTEVFSNFGSLPVQVATPPGFPTDVAVRTDDPAGLPQGAVLDAVRAAFFSPRVKEVLVSPRGLRLVWLAEEADRSRYLIFRDAELGMRPLPPEVLTPLLDHLGAIADALAVADRQGEAA